MNKCICKLHWRHKIQATLVVLSLVISYNISSVLQPHVVVVSFSSTMKVDFGNLRKCTCVVLLCVFEFVVHWYSYCEKKNEIAEAHSPLNIKLFFLSFTFFLSISMCNCCDLPPLESDDSKINNKCLTLTN